MKDAEDEAFDDLAKRQGDWGSGFQAKRAAAADKLQEPPSEWAGIKAVLDEYGLRAIDFVADFKAALAQPTQEPVAWCIEYDGDLLYAEGSVIKKEVEDNFARNWDEGLSKIVPLYAAPSKRPWVGLSDEEIKEIIGTWGDTPIKGYTRKLFYQIEAKLRSKNT